MWPYKHYQLEVSAKRNTELMASWVSYVDTYKQYLYEKFVETNFPIVY